MKAVGIVRKIDSMGRMALPNEPRKLIDVKIGDSVEFFYDDIFIKLKKYIGEIEEEK